eukprot:53056-Eustigmatos_ZCMA.PRE.1
MSRTLSLGATLHRLPCCSDVGQLAVTSVLRYTSSSLVDSGRVCSSKCSSKMGIRSSIASLWG